MSLLHADYAESAEFFIFFSVLRWRWRGRKLRYDESAPRRAGREYDSYPFLFTSAFSVARSERLIQRQRVCFGTLRPLRSLREVCLRAVMSFFARRLRRERRVFLFSLAYYAGAGGVANFVTTRERRGESD